MPPRSPRKRVAQVLSDDDGPSGDNSDSSSQSAHGEGGDFMVQTNFDSYFSHVAARSQTSNTVFSTKIPPLSAEEYAAAIKPVTARPPPFRSAVFSEESKHDFHSRFLRELHEGFNLLFYGFGSKRQYLNDFATERCARLGHVVIANGFHPGFGMKDLLSSFSGLPDFDASPSQATVQEYFISSKHHLYLIIHNIDGPFFRTTKAKSVISLWGMNPHIHILASVDHINAPLLWSTSESSARKQGGNNRGFAWLWHDISTLSSYDFELSFADRTSIRGAHGIKASDTGTSSAVAMTETAALHILASVTQKAKKLFKLMGERQLGISDSESGHDMQQAAIEYDALFSLARDNFVATNDTALRALLGEFKDHGLVLTAQSSAAGGQALWIPLRKEKLSAVLGSAQMG
ncbi:Origin recognition complex subunit 2 [Pleurotus ostreatus]|uniref:Origin recognition complex subunit 2 n=2 Tax=Pleurotus TaxID=5320 RepID=A0A8H6ZM63_PLEOS|nr:Origin recognition complex subunit 2 [Pleurotus ostreatus]KAF7422344.1 Origin recognition complex subunit 2 [Pleurotus ostreatus]KAG9227762.1 hypothetical protein CCMSSC00406_0000592 [Pleurotus cornucopiae]